ncbi:MAG: hypothetical protein ACODAQ_09440, partial [Phycisphaeraceae bacterium]
GEGERRKLDSATTRPAPLVFKHSLPPSLPLKGEGFRLARFTFTVVLALMIALIAGCATNGSTDDTASREATTQSDEEPRDAPQDDDVAESVQSHADRLAEAVERSSPPMEAEDAPQRRVEPAEANRAAANAAVPDAAEDEGEDEPEPSSETTADADAAEPASDEREQPAEPSRAELTRMLMTKVRGADEPAMQRALAAATLSAAMDGAALDAAVLAPLDRAQRQAVQRYHEFVLAMRGELAARGGALEREALHERVDALFDPDPIAIRKLVLCRSVSSYGVYEPYEEHVFLAGDELRLLVYIELDHFRTRQTENGRHEVRLRQEVVLYNASDGLAVWRQDPVTIEDVSRNRRRDFFVVQLVKLPGRLSVGKYRLKVRITDEHGGSIDETTTPIELVADEKLSGK